MADGERVASFSLKGPFLSLGETEKERGGGGGD